MIFSQTFNIRFNTVRIGIVFQFLFLNSLCFSQTTQDDTTVKSQIVVENPFTSDSVMTYVDETTKAGFGVEGDTAGYFEIKKSTAPDSFQVNRLPDSVKKAMQGDKDFWYANHVFEKEKELVVNTNLPLREQIWFKTLMWLIIIGGFVYALILYLGGNNIGLFRRNVKRIAEENQISETENIFEINYKERIARALNDGNYQLAVRLHFLQVLKSLAGKNIIQYKQDRTNFDYLMQLHNSVYYSDFFKLTRNYEYAWFGDFPVNKETYSVIKNDFEKFENGLLRK